MAAQHRYPVTVTGPDGSTVGPCHLVTGLTPADDAGDWPTQVWAWSRATRSAYLVVVSAAAPVDDGPDRWKLEVVDAPEGDRYAGATVSLHIDRSRCPSCGDRFRSFQPPGIRTVTATAHRPPRPAGARRWGTPATSGHR